MLARWVPASVKARWRNFSLTYLGATPAGTYERYGSRGVRWSWYFNSLAMPVGVCVFFLSNSVSRHQIDSRNEIISHIDTNRLKFYGRDAGFRPDYVDKVTTLYDSTRGMVQMDHVTGIGKTTEGKYVGPSNFDLEARLAKAPITDEMIERAKALTQHVAKDEFAQKEKKPLF